MRIIPQSWRNKWHGTWPILVIGLFMSILVALSDKWWTWLIFLGLMGTVAYIILR